MVLFKKKDKKDETALDTTKTESDFKQLLTDSQFFKFPKEGELVKGKVISLGHNEVHVDLDGIATGVVRGREYFDESGQTGSLKIGDEVEATVIDLENENGEVELSFRFAGHQKAWDNLKALQSSGELVAVEIVDANKGGLMIKLAGMSGFLPVSQLSPEKYPRVPGGDKNRILEILKSYTGQKFVVKVFDVNETEDKLIVSQKAAWEEEQRHVIAKYQVGDIVEGKVTATTDFGVFIEFGEKLEGLIHISEIAWQRIDNPSDFVKIGETVKAQIIAIEGSKIFLSIKKLQRDPWAEVAAKYQVGQIVECKVLKVNPFGLFVELDQEIHGLAHVSELSDQPNVNPSDLAKPGDNLKFKIISIEPQNHRLGLSLRQAKDGATVTEKKSEKKSEVKTEEVEEKEDKEVKEKPEKAKKTTKAKKEKKEEAKTEEPVKE